jgi:hypothetical protein
VSLVAAAQLFAPASPNCLSIARQLQFGRANAIVRLRRNQNSAISPSLDQIEDRIKAIQDFKLIFLSAQSTHLGVHADYNWVTRVYPLETGWQKFFRHLKLPDSRRCCSRLLP